MEKSMMPADYLCHKEHLWVRPLGDNLILVGVSQYAQNSLGEIVYVDCPNPPTEIKQDVSFGVIESVKVVSDLISPISGTVLEFNEQLMADPCCINRDPYGEGWLLKVRLPDDHALSGLMSASDYEKYVSGSDI
ncbi:glycine cleavage system protein GcvH [Thiobacillus sp.]